MLAHPGTVLSLGLFLQAPSPPFLSVICFPQVPTQSFALHEVFYGRVGLIFSFFVIFLHLMNKVGFQYSFSTSYGRREPKKGSFIDLQDVEKRNVHN